MGCNPIMFILCRTEERAAGWYRLTREILKLPDAPSKGSSKDKSQKIKRPQPLIKLVMRRFKNSFIFFSACLFFSLNSQVIKLG